MDEDGHENNIITVGARAETEDDAAARSQDVDPIREPINGALFNHSLNNQVDSDENLYRGSHSQSMERSELDSAAPIFPHEAPLGPRTYPVLDALRCVSDEALMTSSEDETMPRSPGSLCPDDLTELESPVLEKDLFPVLTEKDGVIISVAILPAEQLALSELDDGFKQDPQNFNPGAVAFISQTDDSVAQPVNLSEAGDILPAFVTSILHDEELETEKVEYAPLFAHECLSRYDEQAAKSSALSVTSSTLPERSTEDDVSPSLLERFPSDGPRIFDYIRMTERRLSEDFTSDEGSKISSPVYTPETPAEIVLSRRSSPLEGSLHLDKIPEEFALEPESDAPERSTLDTESDMATVPALLDTDASLEKAPYPKSDGYFRSALKQEALRDGGLYKRRPGHGSAGQVTTPKQFMSSLGGGERKRIGLLQACWEILIGAWLGLGRLIARIYGGGGIRQRVK